MRGLTLLADFLARSLTLPAAPLKTELRSFA
jgi:hypothetical protein